MAPAASAAPASIDVREALILFAHGARDPDWALPFRAIRDRVAALRPDLVVELAFLELMTPRLGDAVDELAARVQRITVAPLFMAQGGHLKQDVPRLLADIGERHPGVSVTLLPPVGEIPAILEAISGWLVAALPQPEKDV